MPYKEYLVSCSFSPYVSRTFSNYESFSTSGVGIVGVSESFGNTAEKEAGIYSYTASGSGSSATLGPLPPPNVEKGTADEGRHTLYSIKFSQSTASYIYAESYSKSGTHEDDGFSIYGNEGSTKLEQGSLTIDSDGSFIIGGSGLSTTFYSYIYDTYVVANRVETTYPINFPYIDYVMAKTTTTTTIEVDIRKTSTVIWTYYGPIENSETTYKRLINTVLPHTFSNIKTTCNNSAVIVGHGNKSNTMNIEWIGYNSGGGQKLGLIYSQAGVSKDISLYDKVMMETDSFSSSNKREVFNYGSSFTNSGDEITYTLTYDIITTSEVESQATTLERLSLSNINSFSYGFIKTDTIDTTIYTAGTFSDSVELAYLSEGYVNAPEGTAFAGSGVSYTQVQAISTTSNFTKFVEISGLNKATSFIVRSFVTTTTSYIHRNNASGISVDAAGNPDGRRYSFAPAFPDSVLLIRSPEATNPDTFYTEKASFASFADPNYSTAYKNCSPENCSLVFLALIALNSESYGYGDLEKEKYPSWISVYNGTFAGDRAVTSNESVTVYQSSSYVHSGATNVYQTITYFIANNSASQTTKTISVAMLLADEATSVSRLARTKAENLESAYINSWLPSIPLDGQNVVYTQGLQGDADYNINKVLMNAYTTAQSTFAESATSSFPISTSNMDIYFRKARNKIRIDQAYGEVAFNSWDINLLRYLDPRLIPD
jgi:hypothetical protein